MKHSLLWPVLALGLFLAFPVMAGAKLKELAEYTQYDVTGDGKEDDVLITMETKSDVSTLKIYMNGDACGQYSTAKSMDFWDANATMVKSLSGDYFFLVNGRVLSDDAYFVLFQYQAPSFNVVLETSKVLKARDYMDDASEIRYMEGSDKMAVTSFGRSGSLCTSTSQIIYQIKNHQLVKKSKCYKTRVYADSLQAARKLKVYQKPNGKTKVFTLKKKDKVKVTKLYDSKILWIYVTRLSDGKSGWIQGIKKFSGSPLFVGVEYPDAE